MSEVISKARIEREAQQAAREGMTLRDACPYPWHSEPAHYFTEVFLRTRQEAQVGGGFFSPETVRQTFPTPVGEGA